MLMGRELGSWGARELAEHAAAPGPASAGEAGGRRSGSRARGSRARWPSGGVAAGAGGSPGLHHAQEEPGPEQRGPGQDQEPESHAPLSGHRVEPAGPAEREPDRENAA